MELNSGVRTRDVIRCLGVSVALVIGYLLVGVFISQLFFMAGITDGMIAACGMDIVIAVVLLISMRHDMNIRFHIDVRSVVMFVCMTFVVWFVGIMCATLIYTMSSDVSWIEYDAAVSTSSPMWTMLLSLLFAPVAEELLMRRVLYPYIRRVSVIGAMIFTSLIFAIIHGTLVHLPFTFLLGMLSCLVYESSGSVVPCILLHSFMNALSLFLAPHVTIMPGLMSLPVCGGLFILVTIAIILSMHVTVSSRLISENEPAVNSQDMDDSVSDGVVTEIDV